MGPALSAGAVPSAEEASSAGAVSSAAAVLPVEAVLSASVVCFLPECARTAATGIRSTVPHAHPSSGCGHSARRPHSAHRTVTQASSHTWCLTARAPAPGSSGGETGAPHAHGYVGAA
ncbi:hypothetical protein [Streptomyces griseorubiginosus]|uniref:hypothetical protein n=1 Tax=Streptomyces griseorubiginosus TaxID=67304 RepID=UPI003F5414EB